MMDAVKKMIKGFIFDLDGTIVDSLDTLWRAFNFGVTTHKLEPVVQEQLFGLMNKGFGLADIVLEIYPALKGENGSAKVADIMVAIKEGYLAECEEGVTLNSAAERLFSLLREKGMKIGVATSRTVVPEKIWREFDRLHVTRYIDAVVTGRESPRKPSPESVTECLRRLEIAAEECIFVGDSQADIRAAKAAGVKVVAVASGVSTRGKLKNDLPDYIFNDLQSLVMKLDFILNNN